MRIEFDAAKDAANIAKHGVSLKLAAGLSGARVGRAKIVNGETRAKMIGMIGHDVFVAIVTRRQTAVRVISLRPANRKERREYDEIR